ncbi:hypothetical protein SY88_06445 [Clostridiales bacterium PH28_bin88]|nr:hypothetical protein SY88_06445 [Clostridiales bacterium PH28_bin88]
MKSTLKRTLLFPIFRFVRMAYLSYLAHFSWLSPLPYISTKILLPLEQILFFSLLGIYVTGPSTVEYYVIGNSIQIMALNGIYGASMSIGRERNAGTLTYLFGSPTSRILILIGRTLFHILDGISGTVLGLFVGHFAFGISFAETRFDILAVAVVVTAFATTGLGLFLGSLSLLFENGMFFANLAYVLTLLVSGINLPVENLPIALQFVSAIMPMTNGVAAARVAMVGGSFQFALPLLLRELIIGMTYLTVAYTFFRILEHEAVRLGTIEKF